MIIDETKTYAHDAQVGFEIHELHAGEFGAYEAIYAMKDVPDNPKADLVFVLTLLRRRG